MKYKTADDRLIRVGDAYEYWKDKADTVPKYNDAKILRNMLDEVPSAEPEIIYCKDCKYFEQYKDDGTFESVLKMHQWDGECLEWVGHTYMGWFCSRAERRTEV